MLSQGIRCFATYDVAVARELVEATSPGEGLRL